MEFEDARYWSSDRFRPWMAMGTGGGIPSFAGSIQRAFVTGVLVFGAAALSEYLLSPMSQPKPLLAGIYMLAFYVAIRVFNGVVLRPLTSFFWVELFGTRQLANVIMTDLKLTGLPPPRPTQDHSIFYLEHVANNPLAPTAHRLSAAMLMGAWGVRRRRLLGRPATIIDRAWNEAMVLYAQAEIEAKAAEAAEAAEAAAAVAAAETDAVKPTRKRD